MAGRESDGNNRNHNGEAARWQSGIIERHLKAAIARDISSVKRVLYLAGGDAAYHYISAASAGPAGKYHDAMKHQAIDTISSKQAGAM